MHAATFPIEGHHSIGKGKQSKIAAHSNIDPCKNLRSALPDQNISRPDRLPAVLLDPATASCAVPAVTTCSLPLMMCHDAFSVDFNPRESRTP